MKLYIKLFGLISLVLLTHTGLAQDDISETMLVFDELNNIRAFVDQKLITDWYGVRRNIKLRDFSITFDSTSKRISRLYYPDLIIERAKIILFRKDKPIAFAVWQRGGPEPLNTFYTVAQVGDRYEMQFTLIARRKTGELISLANKLVYNLPLE